MRIDDPRRASARLQCSLHTQRPVCKRLEQAAQASFATHLVKTRVRAYRQNIQGRVYNHSWHLGHSRGTVLPGQSCLDRQDCRWRGGGPVVPPRTRRYSYPGTARTLSTAWDTACPRSAPPAGRHILLRRGSSPQQPRSACPNPRWTPPWPGHCHTLRPAIVALITGRGWQR